jgi:hypothetical protein
MRPRRVRYMLISTDVPGPGTAPACPPAMILAAGVDVEWSKNYQIKNGNVPFCYSVVWLAVPADGGAAAMDTARFWYRSAYVEDASQTASLVASAGEVLAGLLAHAGLIAGHQLCSDLAVLAANAAIPPDGITAARKAWHHRRRTPGSPRILDARYDTGHLLADPSRRLLDVCTELGLDVTQPELRGTSMTALHRRWLHPGDTRAREKITVLNLRHALSTALVAVRAAGLGHWQPGLNVSRMLARELNGAFGWLKDPAFTALLGEPGAA